jgi:flagellin-like protein
MKKEMDKKNNKRAGSKLLDLKNRKGISPIMSTVMLIMIVVIIAVIILLWSQGFIKERILKFDRAIDNVCLDISLETYINPDNTIGLRNKGLVPIQEVKLIISEGGNDVVYPIGPEQGKVGAGLSNTITDFTYSSGQEIKVIPVLLGRTKAGSIQKFTCPDSTGVQV